MSVGSAILAILAVAGAARGEERRPQETARAAQEAAVRKQRAAIEALASGPVATSLVKQKESIRKQAESAGSFRAAEPVALPADLDCEPMPQRELATLIQETARTEGLTPDLLRLVIAKESAARPCAVSSKGAMGLMQLMPDTARELGVSDPFNPSQNVAAGSRLLRRLLDRYGDDLALALGAYNAGPRNVDRRQGLPPFVETVDYVTDIMGNLGDQSSRMR
jgi:soluble lytic murein transglycosylase-like protein